MRSQNFSKGKEDSDSMERPLASQELGVVVFLGSTTKGHAFLEALSQWGSPSLLGPIELLDRLA